MKAAEYPKRRLLFDELIPAEPIPAEPIPAEPIPELMVPPEEEALFGLDESMMVPKAEESIESMVLDKPKVEQPKAESMILEKPLEQPKADPKAEPPSELVEEDSQLEQAAPIPRLARLASSNVLGEAGPVAAGSSAKSQRRKAPAPMKTEAQVAKHRANSAAWHAKWVSKGVPRVPAESEAAAVVAAEPAPGGNTNDLSQARHDFIRHWIENSTMKKSNERRQAAMDAWMNSNLRASLLATRGNVQK